MFYRSDFWGFSLVALLSAAVSLLERDFGTALFVLVLALVSFGITVSSPKQISWLVLSQKPDSPLEDLQKRLRFWGILFAGLFGLSLIFWQGFSETVLTGVCLVPIVTAYFRYRRSKANPVACDEEPGSSQ